MNLMVDFMGLTLKTPIIVAAGPWSRNGEMIKEAIKAGAGAVVTETIVNEVNADIRPRIAYRNAGAQNIRLYSDILLEEWEQEIQIAKECGGVVIASICAQTPSELSYIARKMEKFGADAIELGIASPMGEGLEVISASDQKTYDMTKRVVETVDIPVIVKLSQTVNNLSKIARAVERAGGNAVSAIDTVRCILGVDIQTRKPYLPTYGGYSGAPIRPLGLAAVATIAQSTKLPVCGIGGIETYEHILEYMMLGASTVQIGTTFMLKGFGEIKKLERDLSHWLSCNDMEDLQQIRGAALSHIQSFDEMQVEPKIAHLHKPCRLESCLLCVNCCVYKAIEKSHEGILIHGSRCRGCGLCKDVCPHENINLFW